MLIYNSHFSVRETDPCPVDEIQVKGSEEETRVYKQASALGWKEDSLCSSASLSSLFLLGEEM